VNRAVNHKDLIKNRVPLIFENLHQGKLFLISEFFSAAPLLLGSTTTAVWATNAFCFLFVYIDQFGLGIVDVANCQGWHIRLF